MVKKEWFKCYRENERPERFDRIVQSWDTANKATELSDFSVCTTWGIKGKDVFLLGLFRKRLEYPALKRAVREQQSLFDAKVVLIEDKASGTQLIQELIVDGCHGVTRYQPGCDKIMRLHAQTAMIENGFVHIPETASWLTEYLHEMAVFPRGKHDDQVDSTAPIPRLVQNPNVELGHFRIHSAARGGARTAAQTATGRNHLGYWLDGVASRAGKAQERGLTRGQTLVRYCPPLYKQHGKKSVQDAVGDREFQADDPLWVRAVLAVPAYDAGQSVNRHKLAKRNTPASNSTGDR